MALGLALGVSERGLEQMMPGPASASTSPLEALHLQSAMLLLAACEKQRKAKETNAFQPPPPLSGFVSPWGLRAVLKSSSHGVGCLRLPTGSIALWHSRFGRARVSKDHWQDAHWQVSAGRSTCSESVLGNFQGRAGLVERLGHARQL